MFFYVFLGVFLSVSFWVFVTACAHVPWHSNSSGCRSCLPTAPPGGCGSGLQEATIHCPRLAWQRGGVPEAVSRECRMTILRGNEGNIIKHHHSQRTPITQTDRHIIPGTEYVSGCHRGSKSIADPSLCPATVSLTPSASLNGICNRQ